MEEILTRVARQSEPEILDELFNCSENIGFNKPIKRNGWGGRIRTHEWRDQNPLPYRLATPQSLKPNQWIWNIVKDTISRIKCLIVLAFFLFLIPVQAKNQKFSITEFQSQLVLKQSTNQPIKVIRKYRDGILNENQGQLFFNLDQVNIHNSNNENLEINQIIVDGKDFYLASSLGVFQNYRQIFSKEACSHIEKTNKEIFISCQNGIYRSEFDKKNKFTNFNWQIMPQSPNNINYFSLNKSKSNPNYGVSKQGFYIYNPHKRSWLLSNYGLKRNFQEEYKLGRYLLVEDANKDILIYLPSAAGLMLSRDSGKTWIKDNSGIKSDADGFYTIREIVQFEDQLFLISTTGIYYKKTFSIETWQKFKIVNSKKDEFANDNFFAIDKSKDGLYVSNSQGEIFYITEKQDIKVDNNESDNQEAIFNILKLEPRIQDLHLAALRFSGIPTGKNFSNYRRQAKLRNLLPELQSYIERDNLNYISIETEGSDSFSASSGAFNSSFDRNNIDRSNTAINAGLRLTWSLGDIIFDPEINDINTSARITANVRENILTEITQLYFRRKELLVEIFKKAQKDIKQKLVLDELLAQLDARTGSWYSKQLTKNLRNIELDSDLKEYYYDT